MLQSKKKNAKRDYRANSEFIKPTKIQNDVNIFSTSFLDFHVNYF